MRSKPGRLRRRARASGASAQRAVHRAALDTQVDRAPETVLNNLDVLPIVGNVRSARHFAVDIDKLEEAIKRGDWGAAAGHGLFAVLDGIGAIPLVGNVAKPVLKKFVDGILSFPGVKNAPGVKQLLRRLDDRSIRRGVDPTRRIGESEEEFLKRLNAFGKNPKLVNANEIVAQIVGPRWFAGLKQKQQDLLVERYQDVLHGAAVEYVARRMAAYRSGGGTVLRKDKKLKAPGAEDGFAKPDLIVTSVADKSRLQLDETIDSVFDAKDFQELLILEVKTGKSKASKAQKWLIKHLEETGQIDRLKLLTLPHSELPIDKLIRLTTEGFERSKRLKPEHRDRILKQLRKRLPKGVSGWVFLDTYARVAASLPRSFFMEDQ